MILFLVDTSLVLQSFWRIENEHLILKPPNLPRIDDTIKKKSCIGESIAGLQLERQEYYLFSHMILVAWRTSYTFMFGSSSAPSNLD